MIIYSCSRNQDQTFIGDLTMIRMAVNPLIIEKIDKLNVPDKIKNLLKLMLDTEEQLEIHGTKKDYFKNFDNILDKFAKDEDIIQFGDDFE